jgi:hypothetical protein
MQLSNHVTLPDERYRAIRNTRQFLIDLLDRTTYPRVPREVRAEASRLLKHYPGDYDLERLAEKSPNVIIKEMEPLTKMIMTYEERRNDNAS